MAGARPVFTIRSAATLFAATPPSCTHARDARGELYVSKLYLAQGRKTKSIFWFPTAAACRRPEREAENAIHK